MLPLKTIRPSGGHILDIDSSEIAEQFLSLANNVNTRKGFPSRIGPRRIAYPVSAGHLPNDPLHLLNFQLNDFNWWLSFGLTNIYAVETSNFYDITPVGLSAVSDSREWSSTLLNGIPCFSNGKNQAMYWDGFAASDALVLPDFPVATSCKFIVAFRFHLFALNINGPGGEFENYFRWSDAAAPGDIPASWTPGASNEAGSAFCADTVGPLVSGLPLNTQLLLYKPTSIYAVEYVGQQPDNIFSVRPVVRSIGALGPHCVKELVLDNQTAKHLVVGNDDVVITDGIGVKSIANNRIKIALANSIDQDNAQNAFVIRDITKRETWVCVPETGSQFATKAHIWDEARDAWVTRDLVAARYGTLGIVDDTSPSDAWDADVEVWDSDVSAWDQSDDSFVSKVVIGEANTAYLEDSTGSTTVTSTLAKYDLNFEDDSQNKLIDRVWIRGTGLGLADIQFRLGSKQSPDDSTTWGSFKTMNDDGTPYEISGRYISIEVVVASSNPWTINRLIFAGKYNGPY